MNINPVLEVQVPFWSPYPFYQNFAVQSEVVTSPGFQLQNMNSDDQEVAIYRAVGDDFTMAWPTGCNVMIYKLNT